MLYEVWSKYGTSQSILLDSTISYQSATDSVIKLTQLGYQDVSMRMAHEEVYWSNQVDDQDSFEYNHSQYVDSNQYLC